MIDYYTNVQKTKEVLDSVSKTMCLAKWLQVSIHLPQGLTQSCYHPPTHKIPLEELEKSPKALHNTSEKIQQRKEMLNGQRPKGCQYCWNIEDAPNGPHFSDRHYRSSEWWAKDHLQESLDNVETINPRYVEVNFNQACNFKCVYCSPHLSSEWEKEIKQYGDLPIDKGNHNNIESLAKKGLMPLNVKNAENPYVEAFWKWWPELYKNLSIFRMTGGEPLMDKNTFKILEYVNEHPNSSIDLSITSNMCPADPKLFDKFISCLKEIEKIRIWVDNEKFNVDSGNYTYVAPACKNFTLFASMDSVGNHAEYIRTGLNFETAIKNVKTFLQETHGTEITFINTFNIMSVPKLKEFLQMILDLRVEFGYENQKDVVIDIPDNGGHVHDPFIRKRRQRIWFDIPYLRYPDWMSVENLSGYPEYIEILEDCLEFMIMNKEKEDYGRTYHGFKEYEIAKLKRNIEWIKTGKERINLQELTRRSKSFALYFNEIDRRRQTDFISTFPELKKWWDDCNELIRG